jgi:hypothetical protein
MDADSQFSTVDTLQVKAEFTRDLRGIYAGIRAFSAVRQFTDAVVNRAVSVYFADNDGPMRE